MAKKACHKIAMQLNGEQAKTLKRKFNVLSTVCEKQL